MAIDPKLTSTISNPTQEAYWEKKSDASMAGKQEQVQGKYTTAEIRAEWGALGLKENNPALDQALQLGSDYAPSEDVPEKATYMDAQVSTPTPTPLPQTRGSLYEIQTPDGFVPFDSVSEDGIRAGSAMSARSYGDDKSIVFEGRGNTTNTDFHKEGQQDIPLRFRTEPERPDFLETAGAMVRQDNPVWSYLTRTEAENIIIDRSYTPEDDPNLQPFMDDYYDVVARVPNAEAAIAVAEQLNQEITDRDTLARTSLITQLTLGMAFELVNPINAPMMLINPVAGTFAKTVAMWTAIGMTQEAANEIVLHQSQILRTGDESLENMMMAGAFSTVFAGAGYAFKNRAELIKAAKHAGKYIEDPKSVVPIKNATIPAGMGKRSGGAAEVEQRILNDFAIKPILPEVLKPVGEKIKNFTPDLSPMTKISQSPSLTARMFLPNVADTPMYFNAESNNRIVTNELGSIEARKNTQQGISLNVERQMGQDYERYRKDTLSSIKKMKASGENIARQKQEMYSEHKFMEEVTEAVRVSGGEHDNPHVQAAAQRLIPRYREMLDDFVQTGMLPEEFKGKDTKNYTPDDYDVDEILRDPDAFVDDVSAFIETKVNKAFIDSEKLRGEMEQAKLEQKLMEVSPLDYKIRDEQQAIVNDANLDIVEATAELGKIKEDRRINTENRTRLAELETDINKLDKASDVILKPLKKMETVVNNLHREANHARIKFEKAEEGTKSYDNWQVKAKERGAQRDEGVKAYKAKRKELYAEASDLIDEQTGLEKERDAIPPIIKEHTFDQRNAAERNRLDTAKADKREATKKLEKEEKTLQKQRKGKVEKGQRSVGKVEKRYDAAAKKADVTPEEARIMATEIKDKITGARWGMDLVEDVIPDLPIFEAGATKARVLDMDWDIKKKWLNRNAAENLRKYTGQMTARNEWHRDYNGLDLTELHKQIDAELDIHRDSVLEGITGEGKIAKAEVRLEKERRDLHQSIDDQQAISLGEFAMPKNAASPVYRGAQVVKKLNTLRMLGQVLNSAIPDIARNSAIQGAPKMLKVMKALATNKDFIRAKKADLRKMGLILDIVSNARAHSLADLGDHAMGNSKGERLLAKATDKFLAWTGLPRWNDTMKMIAGVLAQDHMIRTIMQPPTNAKQLKRDIRELRHRGISEDMAENIRVHTQKYGTNDDDIWMANVDQWTKGLEGAEFIEAARAAQAFRSAMHKTVNEIIVSPGEAEMPRWMRGVYGGVMMQFKSFIVSAHSRMLVPALQHMDSERLQSMTLGFFLAGLSYAMKMYFNDRPISDDPGEWAWEMADRSGYMGFSGEIFEMSSRLSGGVIDPKEWTTGKPGLSRFQSRDQAALFLGPTADWYTAFVAAGRGVFTDDLTDSEKQKLRRMIPLQNHPYFKRLFDEMEEAWKD